MKKLTLEDRVSNLEKHICRLQSELMSDSKHKVICEEDESDKDPLTRKALRRFYGALINDSDPAGLDSVIKSCFNNESYSKENLLLLIMLKAITMYRADNK